MRAAIEARVWAPVTAPHLRSSHRTTAALCALLLSGCGLFGNLAGQTASSPPQEIDYAALVDTDSIRQGEREMFARGFDARQLAEHQASLETALELSLGREANPGRLPQAQSASANVRALRKAKIDVWLEPITGSDGRTFEDFVMLQDAYSVRVKELQPKIVKQTATRREMREIQEGSKYLLETGGLRMQVSAAASPAFQAAQLIADLQTTTMGVAAHLEHNRRFFEMEWTDEDYEHVRTALERQREAETSAAIALGLVAVYQAVLDGADPKALDEYAEASLELFPITADVPLEEAKAYVATLDEHIAVTRQVYVSQMRKIMGDEVYERDWQELIESRFDGAEAALVQRSLNKSTPMAQRREISDCFHGRAIDPQSPLAGATCEDYARCGRSEPPEGPEVSEEACATLRRLEGTESSRGVSLDLPKGGGVPLPQAGPIGHVLEGVQAVRDRDARGVIRAAANLAPAGPAKTVLGIAAVVADAVPRVKGRRKRRR